MAAAVAARLGVAVHYVTYPRAGELADTAGTGQWDIGLIGAEPARAERAFVAAYQEIQRVERLMTEAFDKGLIPNPVPVVFAA